MQRKSSSKCFRQTILSTASMFLCTTPIHLVETTVICFYLASNYLKRKSHFLGPWQGCRRIGVGELRCLNVIISLSGWHFSGIRSLPSCRFNSIRGSLLAKLVTWLPASGYLRPFWDPKTYFSPLLAVKLSLLRKLCNVCWLCGLFLIDQECLLL